MQRSRSRYNPTIANSSAGQSGTIVNGGGSYQGTIVNGGGGSYQGTIANNGGYQGTIANNGGYQGTIANNGGAEQPRTEVPVDLRNGDWTTYPALFQVSDNCHVVAELTTATEGAQAKLYAALWNGRRAVLKLFHRMRGMDQSHEQRLRDMYQKLQQCGHAAEILEFGEYQQHWYEVIPFYAKGSLADRRDQQVFSEKEITGWVLPQMNQALQEIHSYGIWHNDIKPENIMINDEDHLVLIDFGVASVSAFNMTVATGLHGTQRYMNSQALEGRYNASTDYYALGVTLYNLMYNDFPVFRYIGAKMEKPAQKHSQRMYELLCGMMFQPVMGNTAKPFCHDEVDRWLRGEKMQVPENRIENVASGQTAKVRLGSKVYELPELPLQLGYSWEEGKSGLVRGTLVRALEIAADNKAYNADQRAVAGAMVDLAKVASESDDFDEALCWFLYSAEELLQQSGLLEGREPAIYWKGESYSTRSELADLGGLIAETVADGGEGFLWINENDLLPNFFKNRQRPEYAAMLSAFNAVKGAAAVDKKMKNYMQGLVLMGLADDAEFQRGYFTDALQALRAIDRRKDCPSQISYAGRSFEGLVKIGGINPPHFEAYRKLPTRVQSYLAAFMLSGSRTFQVDGVKCDTPQQLKKTILAAQNDKKELQKIITAIGNPNYKSDDSNSHPLCDQLRAWLLLEG